MNSPAKILVVDDTPRNVKLLADLLAVKGYDVVTAASGPEALAQLDASVADLVLLDVVMPEMSGYEVCRKIRENSATAMLPVIMVTALDPAEERVKGIDAGADDFLTKPINQAELLARVKSLLRIKHLHDTTQAQAAELAGWNKTLEQRVREQVEQLEKLSRLKRFFSPQLAELIVNGGADDPLKTHRRELTVVYLDLRGFTALSEATEPAAVIAALDAWFDRMAGAVHAFGGEVLKFIGDGVLAIFPITSSPAEACEAALRAVTAARAGMAHPDAARQAQGLAPLPEFGGPQGPRYPVIGSWIVGDQPAGIGIREDDSPITKNSSRFVPHYFS